MKKVRVIYDPILRTATKTVTVFDGELKQLSEEMLAVMHQNIGMGLAANQLGVDKDLLVIEYRPAKNDKNPKPIGPLALCNAKIVKASQAKDIMNEGCLSLPKLELQVERSIGVTVEAQDLSGKRVTIKAKGLLARILQHEIDHLDGVLFTDRANEVKDLRHYANIKIVFFGSDVFSAVIFDQLIAAGLNVMAVMTETDKPAGRGGTMSSPVMKTKAAETLRPFDELRVAPSSIEGRPAQGRPGESRGAIAVFQPESKDEITDILNQLKPELIVLASYGKILPDAALQVPTYGALNVHPSLLPKYRGATPLQSVILAGESETGVTIMKMNAGVDTGEMVAQTTVALANDETFRSLRQKLAEIGGKLLISQLPLYLAGQAKLAVQDPALATGTTKLTKEMGEIDWDQSPTQIDRQIRALNPWPGTFTFIGDKRVKILAALIMTDPSTGLRASQLQLETVQLEGKKPAAWADFVRGYARELKNTAWFGKIHK